MRGTDCRTLLLLFACLLVISGCGRRREDRTEASTEPLSSELVFSTTLHAGPTASAPEQEAFLPGQEDPQAEGFYLDEQLTTELQTCFSGGNTNNTDPSDPYRSLTAKHKEALDRISLQWARGLLTEEDTVRLLEALQFSWEDDPYGQPHSLRYSHLKLYERDADTAENLFDSIRFDNLAARHYLFLAVFRDESRQLLRIYMINGMIW